MAKLIPSETEFALSVPSHCDMCHMTLTEVGDTYVDGKTTSGPWANMCLRCHKAYGFGLGTGKGQRYQRQPSGRYAKMVPASAPTGKKRPSLKTLERWSMDGVAKATDGCTVEPDGVCSHGAKSWLLVEGLV
jgi:hypothetical protein